MNLNSARRLQAIICQLLTKLKETLTHTTLSTIFALQANAPRLSPAFRFRLAGQQLQPMDQKATTDQVGLFFAYQNKK